MNNNDQNQTGGTNSGQSSGQNQINPSTGKQWNENDVGYNDFMSNQSNSGTGGTSGSGTGTTGSDANSQSAQRDVQNKQGQAEA